MKRLRLTKSKATWPKLRHAMKEMAARPKELWSQGRGWRTDKGSSVAARGTPNVIFEGETPNHGVENGQENIPGASAEAGSAGADRADGNRPRQHRRH